MAKGRKPNTVVVPAQVGPEFSGATPPDMAAQEARVAQIEAGTEDAIALGRALGQMETAGFYETISLSVKLTAFESAKKSKAYQLLTNPETGNRFASLEEFCEARLGVGVRRMEQIVNNRDLLGQQTFEQAERLGLRNIDYRALRALPADEQAAVKKVIAETTTREEVIEAIQVMASRHAAIRQGMADEVEELKANATAKDKLIANTKKRNEELLLQAERLKSLPPDQDLAFLRDQLLVFTNTCEMDILGNLGACCRALVDHHSEHGGDSDELILGALRQIEKQLATVRGECGHLGGKPAWEHS